MKDSFSWLTPKQAGELVSYTARHIQNLITKGKLSAIREDGKYYIDKAEFFRVFPKAHKEEQSRNSDGTAAEKVMLETQNDLLKQIAEQKDKEIEFLRNQIEFISLEKTKMLDAIVSHTRILEHKQASIVEKKQSKKIATWRDIFKLKKRSGNII